jgi:uncharacterized protein YjbI with pentapeptide repeats
VLDFRKAHMSRAALWPASHRRHDEREFEPRNTRSFPLQALHICGCEPAECVTSCAGLAGCDFRGADLRDCAFFRTEFGRVNTGDTNGLTDMTGVIWAAGVPTGATFDRVFGLPH